MFWMSVHPVTLLLFVITLVISWKTKRKKNVLIALGGYIVILLVTASFFLPELIELTSAPYSDTIDASLQLRANRWVVLSLIRLGVLIVLGMNLLLGLTKTEQHAVGAK